MRLKEIDSEDAGHTDKAVMKAHCSGSQWEEAEYYYADSTKFDVIGRPQEQPWLDVWIMQSEEPWFSKFGRYEITGVARSFCGECHTAFACRSRDVSCNYEHSGAAEFSGGFGQTR